MTTSFAKYIREKRINAGITLRKAAEILKISAPYLSRIESGLERPPSAEVLQKMAQEYKVEFDEILSHAASEREERQSEAIGMEAAQNPAIFALFKMARHLDDEQIKAVIKKACEDYSLNEQEFLDALEHFRKAQKRFPRIQKGDEGLFAADVRPRRLSKAAIRARGKE